MEDKGCVANDVCVDDVAELLQGDMMTDGEDSLDEEDSVHEHLSTPSEDAGIVGEKRSLSPQQVHPALFLDRIVPKLLQRGQL